MSDDEFGGYAPTTPAINKIRPPSRPSIAGPSKASGSQPAAKKPLKSAPTSKAAPAAKKPPSKQHLGIGKTVPRTSLTNSEAPTKSGAPRKRPTTNQQRSGSPGDDDIVVLDEPPSHQFPDKSAKTALAATAKQNGKRKAVVTSEDEQEADAGGMDVEVMGDDSMGGMNVDEPELEAGLVPKPTKPSSSRAQPKLAARQSRQPSIAPRSTTAARSNSSPLNDTLVKELEKLKVQCRKWEKKARDWEEHYEDTARKLDEVLVMRYTEAEQALEDYRKVHKDATDAQQKSIQELTSQLAVMAPNAHSGKSSILNFVTAEAAAEEKRRALKRQEAAVEAAVEAATRELREENEVKIQEMKAENETTINQLVARHAENLEKWEEAVKERDVTISTLEAEAVDLRLMIPGDEKDQERNELKAQNQQLQETVTHLKEDLAAEIQQHKNLASRNRDNFNQAPVPIIDGPKNPATYQLYENLTNFLVTRTKTEPNNYPQFKDLPFDEVFSCIYTYVDAEAGEDHNKSLYLNLKLHYEPFPNEREILHKNQLEKKITVEPLELDKESDEFRRMISPFNEAFTVARSQMGLILHTLHERLQDAVITIAGDGYGDGDTSMGAPNGDGEISEELEYA